MNVSSAVFFGLLAMFGNGLSNAISREPTRKLGPTAVLFWRQAFLTLLWLPPFLFTFPRTDVPWGWVMATVLLGAVGYLPIRLFYRAIERGKVGIVSPIAGVSSVLTAGLAVLVLGEPFGPGRWFGVPLVIAGVLLLSADVRDWKASDLFRRGSGIPCALLACLGWGVIIFLFRYPVLSLGMSATAFIVEAVILAISAAALSKERKITFPRGYIRPLSFVGILSAVATVGLYGGLGTAAVSTVVVLGMANPIISAAYERLVLRERFSTAQYAGMVFTVAGVAFVAVVS